MVKLSCSVDAFCFDTSVKCTCSHDLALPSMQKTLAQTLLPCPPHVWHTWIMTQGFAQHMQVAMSSLLSFCITLPATLPLAVP